VKTVLLLAFCAVFATSVSAQTKSLQNLDKSSVAIQDYDPVAFFTQGKPVLGNPQFESTFHGAHYRFVSAEDKSAFDANPAKYEPQFGGFCAFAVSKGKTAPVKVEAFMIVNGRLLMQYDLDVKQKFQKDPQGNLAQADRNWPDIVEKQGQ
jgi:YHS domain-containing protein